LGRKKRKVETSKSPRGFTGGSDKEGGEEGEYRGTI